ncbi:hypothetical protein NX059_012300 [Plenodomus lindquistii]|nr:hypothetical protein NX059_012300 [Plenodomus lindquistii]
MNIHKDAFRMLSGGSIMNDIWPPRTAMHTADTVRSPHSDISTKLTQSEIDAFATALDAEIVPDAELVEKDMSFTTQDGKVRSTPWEFQHCGPPIIPRQRKEEVLYYEPARILIVTYTDA